MSGLDLEVIGKKSPEVRFEYNWRKVVLYALGIGAQIDELPFIYENVNGRIQLPINLFYIKINQKSNPITSTRDVLSTNR